MSVLQEYQNFDYQVLTEEKATGTKKTLLKGLLQQANIKNGNGRVYPKHILEREIAKNIDRIKNRQMLGELDHPSDGKIHLEKVSHCITELNIDDEGRVYGVVEVFDGSDAEGGTPYGRILGSLVRRGVKLGISSRGFGSIKNKNGVSEVQDDFKLITFDIVSDPSTPNAYPDPVFEDSGRWEKTKTIKEVLNENLN